MHTYEANRPIRINMTLQVVPPVPPICPTHPPDLSTQPENLPEPTVNLIEPKYNLSQYRQYRNHNFDYILQF